MKTVRFTWHVLCDTIHEIFHDPGVLIIFIVAGLLYPVLYNAIYWNNTLTDVHVAVIDKSGSPESVRFVREWDATPEVHVAYRCTSMLEAEKLMKAQKVHGILYIPADYEKCIETATCQGHLSLYLDMTSFLYMKAVFMSANMVMLNEMHDIQIDRYQRLGYGEEFAWELVQAAPYEDVRLYNESDGYGTFLVPAVLVLILHQTMFFGICMLMGTAKEEKRHIFKAKAHHWSHAILVNLGMAIAFLLVYMALGAVDLVLIPRVFSLPHIGNIWSILRFLVPFFLATAFFSIFVAGFIGNRETGMVLLITTSLIFLFISGVSWPQVSIPKAWRIVSYFIPSTWGIHGYLHINSMGALASETTKEFDALWILTFVYMIAAAVQTYIQIRSSSKEKKPRRHKIAEILAEEPQR